MSAGKVVLGTMVGLATGAALGVLFAPDKGANTRKKLSKKGSAYIGTLKDMAEGGMDSIKETATSVSERVKGAVDSLAGTEAPQHTRRT